MNCLEFKRLALADPRSDDTSFIEHSEGCPDCLEYVGDIRIMDSQLENSLDVQMPKSLSARLELNQVLESDKRPLLFSNYFSNNYAKAACIAAVLFASAFLLQGAFVQDQKQLAPVAVDNTLNVSQGIIAKVVDHVEAAPVLPMWNSELANRNMQSLLAMYDPSAKSKEIAGLHFIKICPVSIDDSRKIMHANLETDHGQITFAYIKGDSVNQASDNSYKGYMTRIRPMRGGNLLLIGKSMYAMEEADKELESAIYWDL